MRGRAPCLCVLVLWALTGCSVGPAVIRRDRTDYSSAMASSWKEMRLLNIVKFRYFDPPTFVDISSVISAAQLEGQANIAAAVFGPAASGGSSSSSRGNQPGVLAVSGSYSDRPTVSYTPIAGAQFVNLLLRPIPPATIFSLINSGHPADFLLKLTVNRINGLSNYSLAHGRGHTEDPKFRRLLAALRRLQQAEAIAVRTIQVSSKPLGTAVSAANPPSAATGRTRSQPSTTSSQSRVWTVVLFQPEASPAAARDVRLVKSLLGLDPRRNQFVLTGEPRHTLWEIAVQSRSMQDILSELAAGVDVPQEEVAEGRATPVPALGGSPDTAPLIHIYSGPAPPNDAYTAVRYRDRWFWIDDSDLQSKRDFMFLLVFYALSETRAIPQAPVVTISASGR
jgi:hypothetical protein